MLLKVSPSVSDAGIIATDSVSSQENPQYIANLTTNRRILPVGAINSDRNSRICRAGALTSGRKATIKHSNKAMPVLPV